MKDDTIDLLNFEEIKS